MPEEISAGSRSAESISTQIHASSFSFPSALAFLIFLLTGFLLGAGTVFFAPKEFTNIIRPITTPTPSPRAFDVGKPLPVNFDNSLVAEMSVQYKLIGYLDTIRKGKQDLGINYYILRLKPEISQEAYPQDFIINKDYTKIREVTKAREIKDRVIVQERESNPIDPETLKPGEKIELTYSYNPKSDSGIVFELWALRYEGE